MSTRGKAGKHAAVVALARRLADILYALLRDHTVYAPQRRKIWMHYSWVAIEHFRIV
jgi:hypothetical protein